VRIAKEASLVDGANGRQVHVAASLPEHDGCFEIAERGVHLRVEDIPPASRGRLVFKTCAPKIERTPDTIETNPIEVRPH
jgi:hypothetical protein